MNDLIHTHLPFEPGDFDAESGEPIPAALPEDIFGPAVEDAGPAREAPAQRALSVRPPLPPEAPALEDPLLGPEALVQEAPLQEAPPPPPPPPPPPEQESPERAPKGPAQAAAYPNPTWGGHLAPFGAPEPIRDAIREDSASIARPLVEPVPIEEYTSTPLSLREGGLSKSLCRRCTHGWEQAMVEPTQSQTFTPLRFSLVCLAIRDKPNDVTQHVRLRCTLFNPVDGAEDGSPVEVARSSAELAELAHSLRTLHALTPPPPSPSKGNGADEG